MTTKNTNIDYYEKDWDELTNQVEENLEEQFGLDLADDLECIDHAQELIDIIEADDEDTQTLVDAVDIFITEKAEVVQLPSEIKAFDFTAEDLEQTIKAAQIGDRKAVEQLYYWFKPLILKAAHSYTIYTILGEDAENIAWTIFYEFIYQYRGDKFKVLPGLLRMVVNYRLMDAAKARANYDPHVALDEFTVLNTVGQDVEYWDSVICNVSLLLSLRKLPAFQQTVIKLVYFEDCTQRRIAKILGKSYDKIRYHHMVALCSLKVHYLYYENMR